MKYCINCGKRIHKSAKFCPYCGSTQNNNVIKTSDKSHNTHSVHINGHSSTIGNDDMNFKLMSAITLIIDVLIIFDVAINADMFIRHISNALNYNNHISSNISVRLIVFLIAFVWTIAYCFQDTKKLSQVKYRIFGSCTCICLIAFTVVTLYLIMKLSLLLLSLMVLVLGIISFILLIRYEYNS